MSVAKNKRFLVFFALILFAVSLFAAADPAELVVRYTNQANEAFENGDIKVAYQKINLALNLSGSEESDAGLLYTAQTIYSARLQTLIKQYSEDDFLDVQMNLEKFPAINNAKVKKLVKQVESEENSRIAAAKKAEDDAQKKLEQERFNQQQESLETQSQLMKDQADAMNAQTEALKQQAEVTMKAAAQTAEMKEALASGLKDMGDAFASSANETKRSTRVIAFSIIGIAFIILMVILLIVIIVKKGFQQQQIQQEQYVQAFKMLAANQSQTNRIMLGGVTDLYGSNPTLRLAGSSTWGGASLAALPDVEFSEADQEELKQLAIKCEEIGAEIDHITGRKNNSKNVSELVYKLSMQLGLPQGMAMLNFCAAMIYDAGFLGMDAELLSATSLTDEQKKAIKEHVNLAEKHLDFVPKKYWSVFEDAAEKHHENMDGTGYPKGLKGEEIPQIARLIRVAETYVSLSSKRNYRETMDKETAVEMLKSQPQFYDPEVVNTLEQIV